MRNLFIRIKLVLCFRRGLMIVVGCASFVRINVVCNSCVNKTYILLVLSVFVYYRLNYNDASRICSVLLNCIFVSCDFNLHINNKHADANLTNAIIYIFICTISYVMIFTISIIIFVVVNAYSIAISLCIGVRVNKMFFVHGSEEHWDFFLWRFVYVPTKSRSWRDRHVLEWASEFWAHSNCSWVSDVFVTCKYSQYMKIPLWKYL